MRVTIKGKKRKNQRKKEIVIKMRSPERARFLQLAKSFSRNTLHTFTVSECPFFHFTRHRKSSRNQKLISPFRFIHRNCARKTSTHPRIRACFWRFSIRSVKARSRKKQNKSLISEFHGISLALKSPIPVVLMVLLVACLCCAVSEPRCGLTAFIAFCLGTTAKLNKVKMLYEGEGARGKSFPFRKGKTFSLIFLVTQWSVRNNKSRIESRSWWRICLSYGRDVPLSIPGKNRSKLLHLFSW